MDKRKHYIMVLDTETANTLTTPEGKLDMSNVLVYDCGFAVVDTHGQVYETHSFVNREIFCYERELMQSAYYAEKIPRYIEDLRNGTRKMADLYEIRKCILDTLDKWNIKEVAAHNMRFDYNALNVTERWCTKSRFRYFFPFERVELWDTMKMAQDVVCKMPTYKRFCKEHGFVQKNGVPRKTAEVLFRYITDNPEFEESHTGLEDVLIESKILAYCFKQHKPMRKTLWKDKKEFPEQTDFQRALLRSLRETPVIRYGA